jgi:hypothetical protein
MGLRFRGIFHIPHLLHVAEGLCDNALNACSMCLVLRRARRVVRRDFRLTAHSDMVPPDGISCLPHFILSLRRCTLNRVFDPLLLQR